ncbi:hypothetical protein LC607_35970 [Nostoc sp. CHAB 5824]|nr:hypothetical protein [Nostoc sp. CHAB 5824]
MNQPPDNPIGLHAPRPARAPWWSGLGIAAVVIALSILLGFHSPVSSGTGRAVAAAQTAPALVAGESRDYAEGAREDRHRDLPAKKARLTALKVKTTRAPGHTRDAASRLSSSRRGHAGPQPDPRMPDASAALHRLDPSLSLHHGQAPPVA